MIYENWMSYIKDDVKLTNLIIPSAHNSGSYGMNFTGCCQDDGIYTQFVYGIRHFCLRLDTNKKGVVIMCHGIAKGRPFEEALNDFSRIIKEFPTEFFIIDLREYYEQKVGPFTLRYKADPDKINELLAKYIDPSKYAYCDYGDINEITMGDIRASGKKYLLINYKSAYKYSVNCPNIAPWDKIVNGMHATSFVKATLSFFDDYNIDGLYWFQTQQTPNLGTQIGFRSPRKLDRELRAVYYKIIEGIADNPKYLNRANIIGGDFMTQDYLKSRHILMLNILKGNVEESRSLEFLHGLWRCS